MPPIQNKQNKGFTLVELLVVIAIIALLMSILIPSLQKAKESARKMICSARMHDFALAFNMYAGDNNQQLPPGTCLGFPDWCDRTLKSGGLSHDFLDAMHFNGNYMNEKFAYACPSWISRVGKEPPAAKKRDPGRVHWLPSDYWNGGSNRILGHWYGYHFWHRQAKERKPDFLNPKTLPQKMTDRGSWLLMSDKVPTYVSYTGYGYVDNLNQNHISSSYANSGGNYLYLDGHVDWYSIGQAYRTMRDGYRTAAPPDIEQLYYSN